jgi:hypothetical protein
MHIEQQIKDQIRDKIGEALGEPKKKRSEYQEFISKCMKEKGGGKDAMKMCAMEWREEKIDTTPAKNEKEVIEKTKRIYEGHEKWKKSGIPDDLVKIGLKMADRWIQKMSRCKK